VKSKGILSKKREPVTRSNKGKSKACSPKAKSKKRCVSTDSESDGNNEEGSMACQRKKAKKSVETEEEVDEVDREQEIEVLKIPASDSEEVRTPP
jgi:hypothetical protein